MRLGKRLAVGVVDETQRSAEPENARDERGPSSDETTAAAEPAERPRSTEHAGRAFDR